MVCRAMGWDYWTWAKQPTWFLKEVWEHLSAEAAVIPDRGKSSDIDLQLQAGSQRR